MSDLRARAAEAEEQGDFALAETCYRQAIDARFSAANAVRLCRTLILQQKKADAEAWLDHARAAFPDDTTLALLYVRLDLSCYDFAGVRDHLAAALRATPRDAARHGRLALALAWDGDVAAALPSGRRAILLAPPAMSDAIRLLLARRIANLGHVDLADRLCRIGRDARDPMPILLDRIAIRARNAIVGTATDRLFDKALRMASPYSRPALFLDHIDYQWRFRGVSDDLLEKLNAHCAAPGTAADLDAHLTRLALAMQLGEDALALAILTEHPALAERAGSSLPLSRLLIASNRPVAPALRAVAERNAALFDAFARGERIARARLGAADRTVAVVGNSGCEIGRGHGPAIDAHDEVVRFNRFDLAPPFDRDYGTRTSVWVRAGQERPEGELELSRPKLIFISSASIVYRGKAWRSARRLHEEGHILCAFPPAIHAELTRKLGGRGSPSSGISLIYTLKKWRKTLRRKDFFGFSFTDQIGSQAASAHYFEAAKPSVAHQWERERALFDRLMDEPR